MTLTEIIGGGVGTLAAAVAAYGAVSAKLNAVVGKKDAPGDGSLRDLVMKLDGKLDAQHAHTNENFRELDERLTRVEARVFTPPNRPAFFRVAGKHDE